MMPGIIANSMLPIEQRLAQGKNWSQSNSLAGIGADWAELNTSWKKDKMHYLLTIKGSSPVLLKAWNSSTTEAFKVSLNDADGTVLISKTIPLADFQHMQYTYTRSGIHHQLEASGEVFCNEDTYSKLYASNDWSLELPNITGKPSLESIPLLEQPKGSGNI